VTRETTQGPFDVAIVGYGPVGQSLAIMLGAMGRRTIVLEREPRPYHLPRACHFDHEGMHIFGMMGLADAVSAVSVPAREYLLLRGDGSLLADLPRTWTTPSGWHPSYHFYQPDVEAILDARARALPGVTVRRGVTVVDVDDRGDHVRLVTDAGAGPADRIEARFVIGADGANSVVRRRAGIACRDLGFAATWAVADVRVKDGHAVPRIPDTAQICDPRQPMHMAWLGGRHLRWEFMLVDGADPVTATRPEFVWPKIRRWAGPENAELTRCVAYTFRSLVAERFNQGRVLLAGDAAHLMPPFMGQGMVSGLRDAATLGWMLDRVLGGRSPIALLDHYTASRAPHVTAYIEESVRVGRIICETDPEKARVRDEELLAARNGPGAPFQPPAGDLWRPGPASGRLWVQPLVAAGRPLGSVLAPGFLLLVTDPAVISALPARTAARLPGLGVAPVVILPAGSTSGPARIGRRAPQAEVFVEQDGRFHDWMAEGGHLAVLVRPDGYVYGTSPDGDDLVRLVDDLAADLGATSDLSPARAS
jgi:3-(3-hydroxy-phenyl)propionate hydroxylase